MMIHADETDFLLTRIDAGNPSVRAAAKEKINADFSLIAGWLLQRQASDRLLAAGDPPGRGWTIGFFLLVDLALAAACRLAAWYLGNGAAWIVLVLAVAAQAAWLLARWIGRGRVAAKRDRTRQEARARLRLLDSVFGLVDSPRHLDYLLGLSTTTFGGQAIPVRPEDPVCGALARIMPLAGEEHAGAINGRRRKEALVYLHLERAHDYEALILALLGAIARVGGPDFLGPVRAMADGRIYTGRVAETEDSPAFTKPTGARAERIAESPPALRVREAARECLAAMENRQERVRQTGRMLRPADRPEADDRLLRTLPSPADSDGSLLRPSGEAPE